MTAPVAPRRQSPAPPQNTARMTAITRDGPAHDLACDFAARIQRWARVQGATLANAQAAADAARAVSLATSEGHVCWPLQRLAVLWVGSGAGSSDSTSGGNTGGNIDTATQALRTALLASGVVGTPSHTRPFPLVLDDDHRLYLQRSFDHEQALAQRLMAAASAPAAVVPDAARDTLQALFGAAPSSPPNWQQLAAALALRQRLVVISGGPGTGKTTTVVQLLACLLAADPQCRIALAAPTGKAAARMAQALQERAQTLPPQLRALLPREASTVHRLLGATPTPGVFQHHAGQPLPLDALVVDEASMLDLALARRLLCAMPLAARIILLGDKDQLAAVESGAVFADLCQDPRWSLAVVQDMEALCQLPTGSVQVPQLGVAGLSSRQDASPGPLHNNTVWFTQNHRFAADSGIGRLAADVQGARVDAALAWLREGADASVQWLPDDGQQTTQTLQRAEAGFAEYFRSVEQAPFDAAAAHAALAQFRVLCALREGPRGALAANAFITAAARKGQARRGQPSDPRSPWFLGRPVMVLANDPGLRLFNGDIGIALPLVLGAASDPASNTATNTTPKAVADAGADADADVHAAAAATATAHAHAAAAATAADSNAPAERWAVWFPLADGWRAVAPARLPAHDTAFAMTVHKAQGSEFERVLVLLPAQRSRVLSRELLYTAITRARTQVLLAGSAEVLAAAMRTPTRRYSGLLARLREAAGLHRAPDPD